MQADGMTTEWEEKHREEYNNTGDRILVAHTVCKFFHNDVKDCTMRRGD